MGYGRDTYENFGTALKVLWTLTLISLIRHRDGTLSESFRRNEALKDNERIATDLSEVSELQDDLKDKSEVATRFFQMGVPFVQINERLRLGFDAAIPGSDQPYAGRSFPAPGGAPAPAADAKGLLATARRKSTVPEIDSEEHINRMKALEDRQDPTIKKLKRKLKKEIQRQEVEALRNLRNERAFGQGKHLSGDKLKAAADDVFDLDAEIEKFIDTFRALIEEGIERAGDGEAEEFPLGIDFDLDRPEVQKAIDETLREMAEKVNKTTYNELIDLFQAAEAAGESIPQIQERLSAFFGGRKSDFETERIARTTMVGADNAGAMNAYLQSSVVEGMGWLTAIDGRQRSEHEQAHGQIVMPGEEFLVGGEKLRYPGDPQGSAGNIINCRCGVIPIIK
jgi:hypothetical protein